MVQAIGWDIVCHLCKNLKKIVTFWSKCFQMLPQRLPHHLPQMLPHQVALRCFLIIFLGSVVVGYLVGCVAGIVTKYVHFRDHRVVEMSAYMVLMYLPYVAMALLLRSLPPFSHTRALLPFRSISLNDGAAALTNQRGSENVAASVAVAGTSSQRP